METVRIGREGRLELDARRLVVNPGSVGQPRDGDPRASYMLIDTDAGAVTWHRVAYDVAATQRAIMAAGLPANLALRLAFGK
jgi:diadenosine tetraphosphatase ApaH/serine/threonine PP2A family protein phosphatase